jgi:D-xylose transport system permease protein
MNTGVSPSQNTAQSTGRTSLVDKLIGGDFSLLPVILSLILIWAVFEIVNPHFLTGRNMSNLVLQMAEIGTLAIGETLILLLAEIDLSIAALSGVCGAVLGLLASNNFNPWLAMGAAILTGAIIGGFQGFWVTIIGVPAFIVTLAGSLGYQGLLLALIGQEGSIPIMNNTLLGITSAYLGQWEGWVLGAIVVALYAWTSLRNQSSRKKKQLTTLSSGQVWSRVLAVAIGIAIVVYGLNSYQGIPVAGLILFVFVAGFALLTQATSFGRHIFALGGNPEASRRSGINVKRMKIIVFTLSGALAAVGGIIGASRLGSSTTSAGGGDLLMDSIAAAVIGGTSLFGGRGSVWNALAGALVISSIENGMDLLSAPSSTKYLVEGGILLIAVTFDTFTRKRRQRMGK